MSAYLWSQLSDLLVHNLGLGLTATQISVPVLFSMIVSVEFSCAAIISNTKRLTEFAISSTNRPITRTVVNVVAMHLREYICQFCVDNVST